MEKFFATILVFTCFCVVLFAQKSPEPTQSKFTLGVLAGINIPKLTGNSSNPLSNGYGSRLGAAFGFTSSYSFSRSWGLRTDLLYSSEGGRRNGMQAFTDASSYNPNFPAGTYLYANFKTQSILNYLELPVLAKYSFPTKKNALKFYVDFGPYFGYLLNAKQVNSGNSYIYYQDSPITPGAQSFDTTTSITSSINRFNMGITGGVGVSHKFCSGNIFLDVRGAYGLLNIQKYSEDGKSHNGNVCIAVGYSIPL